NQADALAGLDGQVGVIQQRMMAICQLDLGKRNQCCCCHALMPALWAGPIKLWCVRPAGAGSQSIAPQVALGRGSSIVAGYNAGVRQVGQSRCVCIEEGPDSTEQDSG